MNLEITKYKIASGDETKTIIGLKHYGCYLETFFDEMPEKEYQCRCKKKVTIGKPIISKPSKEVGEQT